MAMIDPLQQFLENIPSIEEKLGYSFMDKNILLTAFTHRSIVNEMRGKGLQNNERLEFLGDSVLGLVVAEYLYQKFPDQPEGKLSQLRSRIVDAQSCAQFLQKLGLGDSILLGRGERISEGQGKISILANAFEALIAAIFLDGGIDAVKDFLITHFSEQMELSTVAPSTNFKAELQDFSQKHFQKPPVYQVIEEGGPEHAKIFHVVVFLDGKEVGRGIGNSKKEAEQKAASDALSKRG